MNSPLFHLRIVLAGSILGLLSSCATVPPIESRISRDPQLFENLPESHKESVLQGRVKEGMSKDAVYLAWGRADEIQHSSRDGKELEAWLYLGTEAIPRRTFSVGYGWGWDPCYGYGGPGYGMGVDYDYRHYVAAKAEFRRGKVVSWEQNQRAR